MDNLIGGSLAGKKMDTSSDGGAQRMNFVGCGFGGTSDQNASWLYQFDGRVTGVSDESVRFSGSNRSG